MSKFSWVELPTWDDADSYGFTKLFSKEEWAWEFLRRDPAYRQDYKTWQSDPSVKVFVPDRLSEENENAWRKRSIEMNVDPRCVSLAVHLGRKWQLPWLFDPEKPWEEGHEFLNPPFPIQVFFEGEFVEYLKDDEEAAVSHVAYDRAIVAFDMTMPLTPQIQAAKIKLSRWKQTLLDTERLAEAEAHAGSPNTWIRHLQIIDARRTIPQPTLKEIAKRLWTNSPKDADNTEFEKKGGDFYAAAKKVMRNYRKILRYAGKLAPP